ncbi:AAA family ATPase [Alicyclobacillus tolerans]|uniref:AAA family ATPase n=1 Tax=Alicyclobacillus tolerans TaxID=90970 RepID=UPI001F00B595|nr:AAA family ATPase [Alicyclobacillus tolerans]MCF8563200.1 AAA family ATPase [Alicyclobacillus tolerans]
MQFDFSQVLKKVQERVVGRRSEMAMILSAIRVQRPVLLVGVPGVSKTTILKALMKEVHGENGLFTATGDEQLSVHGLVGTFDPSLVIKDGYKPEYFVPGPLTKAMQTGGMFYLEELNRTPSNTLNVLMTALSDRYLDIPYYGRVEAAHGFSFVASSNPLDDIGTDRLSRGLADRFITLELTYQSEAEEQAIVARMAPSFSQEWIAYSVQIARMSRRHPDLLYGASVRGSIDFLLMLSELVPVLDEGMLLEVGVAAFSGRVSARPSADRTARDVILEIMQNLDTPPPDKFRELWNDSGGNPAKGSQGGAMVEAGETPARSISGGAVQGDPPKETRIDMAWQDAGSGGTKGATDRKPGPSNHLQFGTTQEMERLREWRPDQLVDKDVIQRWVRASYMRVKGGSDASLGVAKGKLTTVPLGLQPAAEIDVPATVSNLVSGPFGTTPVMVRQRSKLSRRFVLFVDHSGSMIGSKLVVSAALASVLTQLSVSQHIRFEVYAFDQGIQPIKELSEAKKSEEVIDEILRLPEGRSTDLGGVFRYGSKLLERWPDCEVILVSDCMPTRGEKTFLALKSLARKIPKLFILQVAGNEGRILESHGGNGLENLDLYGLWALRWVGPERFRCVDGIGDLPEALKMIAQFA